MWAASGAKCEVLFRMWRRGLSQRKKIVVAAAAMIVAVLGLGVIILRGSPGNYWLTPEEFLGRADAQGAGARVGGKIVGGTLETGEGLVSFDIKTAGEKRAMPVRYYSYLPENFSDLSEVVVEGSWRDGAFDADKILIRCPENYLPEKATISTYKALGIRGALYR